MPGTPGIPRPASVTHGRSVVLHLVIDADVAILDGASLGGASPFHAVARSRKVLVIGRVR